MHLIHLVLYPVVAFCQQFLAGLHHFGVQDIGILFGILIMDAALSGDNSIAINALAMNVPNRSRGKVIWMGLGVAAILRVVCLGFATFIMANPWVQVLGGLYLFYLVYKHFTQAEDSEEEGKKPHSMLKVLIGIGLLDLSLSTDNIVAVVAMSNNLAVIVIGVLMSIILLAVASQLVRVVMGKFPSLEPGAYFILAFLGVMMLAEHGAETVVWLGDKISAAKHVIQPLHYSLGDMGEIAGVSFIIVACIARDIHLKRKQKNLPIPSGQVDEAA